jgi:hypothetical protein
MCSFRNNARRAQAFLSSRECSHRCVVETLHVFTVDA